MGVISHSMAEEKRSKKSEQGNNIIKWISMPGKTPKIQQSTGVTGEDAVRLYP